MNERIKQLANKAGITVVEHPFDDATQSWNDSMAKFAELIAYECTDLALGSSHREDDMGAIIANKIKQHFGVEL